MATKTNSTLPEKFTISRTFNAPQQLVFDAFASEEAMGAWWGPAGSKITVLSFDFIEGGKFHYRLDDNGMTMWAMFKYQKIQSPDFIEYVSHFSDEAGGLCKSPFPFDFPLQVQNKMTFSGRSESTTITLEAFPINPTESEQQAFTDLFSSMEQGFGGTLDQLEGYLQSQK